MTGGFRVGIDVSAVPAEPVGAGRYVVELVRALDERATLELVLVAGKGDADRWWAMAPRATVEARVPRPRWRRLGWEQVGMPGLIKRLELDVFHSPHYTMPELAKVSRVVTIHDMTFFDHPEWHERVKVPVFRRAIRSAATLADAIVCVSEATATRLRALHPPVGPLHVIPHGVDHRRFHPAVESGDEDALLGLGIRPPYLVFLSTIQPRKDVPTLVRAFDTVAPDYSDLSLVIAGGAGWDMQPSEDAMTASPFRERIVRTGWIADDAVPALLRSAAAVVYPALEEGFGLPALEALACGTPLITTRGTAMEEFAGEDAWLFDAGDVKGLVAAIRRVLAGGEDVTSRRLAGIERAGHYTWSAAAAAHEAVYLAVSETRTARQ